MEQDPFLCIAPVAFSVDEASGAARKSEKDVQSWSHDHRFHHADTTSSVPPIPQVRSKLTHTRHL